MMNQILISGLGSISSLPDSIRSLGIKKVMVFHGKNSFSVSGAADVLSSCLGIDISYYSDITTNPTVDSLERAANSYMELSPELVLAIGGGSVIDTAKGVLLHCHGGKVHDRRPRFWVVPTTAGSGSEATRFAVVYEGERKKSIENDLLLPDVVILDAELLSSCTMEQMIASGSDALCQCIESLWCPEKTTTSIRFAEAGICLLRDGVFRLSKGDCLDVDTWMSLIMGAHFSGCAINITRTTAGHALSYGLTKKFGLPHGLAVLAVMQFLVQIMDDEYSYFSYDSSIPFKREDKLRDFPKSFNHYCENIWNVVDISRFFIQKDRTIINSLIEELAFSVNIERLSNHPIRLSSEDIKFIYRSIFNRHVKFIE